MGCVPSLVRAAAGATDHLQLDEAALILRAFSNNVQFVNSKLARDLKETLVSLLRDRRNELKPETAAVLVPALAKLRVSDSVLIAGLAHHVASNSDTLQVHDMAA